MEKVKNSIVHFEIPADNTERAMRFYKDTFGWEIEKFDIPATDSTGGNPYFMVRTAETDEKGMVKTPGAINGGMMKRKAKGQPFMNYVNVKSINEMLPKIKENGGTICLPKTEIAPNLGFIAAFQDTEGNMMGLHELDENMKKEGSEEDN